MTIDLKRFMVKPEYEADGNAVKKARLNLKVGKPTPEDYFMIKAGPEFTVDVMLHEDKESRDNINRTYLVDPEVVPYLWDRNACKSARIFYGITSTGKIFLSDVGLPKPGQTLNAFNSTRLSAYEIAKNEFIAIVAGDAGYDVKYPMGKFPDPIWPEEYTSIEPLIDLAYKDRVIETLEHPIVKRILGI